MSTVTLAVLYPGHSAEDEYPLLERAIGGVRLPVLHTWEGPTEHGVAALRALGAEERLVPVAARARELRPDAVVWACTSGSFVYGADGARTQAGWVSVAAGVPATSTSLAFVAALQHLGLRRVSVAATYPEPVTRHFTGLLADEGVEVCATSSSDVPTGEHAGRLDPEAVARLILGSGHPDDAEAVLVPDTALHTIATLPGIEAALGRPVLTANQVSAWHGLRLGGWRGRADGLGSLFVDAGEAPPGTSGSG